MHPNQIPHFHRQAECGSHPVPRQGCCLCWRQLDTPRWDDRQRQSWADALSHPARWYTHAACSAQYDQCWQPASVNVQSLLPSKVSGPSTDRPGGDTLVSVVPCCVVVRCCSKQRKELQHQIIFVLRPVERGRKGEKFSRTPRHLGAPPLLKDTENGVPDELFLTWNMRKIHFRLGLCPGPCWEAYDAPPDP